MPASSWTKSSGISASTARNLEQDPRAAHRIPVQRHRRVRDDRDPCHRRCALHLVLDGKVRRPHERGDGLQALRRSRGRDRRVHRRRHRAGRGPSPRRRTLHPPRRADPCVQHGGSNRNGRPRRRRELPSGRRPHPARGDALPAVGGFRRVRTRQQTRRQQRRATRGQRGGCGAPQLSSRSRATPSHIRVDIASDSWSTRSSLPWNMVP